MQDLKDDEGELAVRQLSSSMEQLRLSSSSSSSEDDVDEVKRIRKQMSDCAFYSGVGIILFRWISLKLSLEMKATLSRLNFKHIEVDHDTFYVSPPALKTIIATIAQSRVYPGPPPFVIAVFVSGLNDHTAHSLHRRDRRVDVVEDIIKPFLPQPAPHLVHIPKLFFISSNCRRKELDTQPPLFPNDPDANYCIAYHTAAHPDYTDIWFEHIAHNLTTGQSVQEIIENIRSSLDHDCERLHYFSSLKDSNLVLRK